MVYQRWPPASNSQPTRTFISVVVNLLLNSSTTFASLAAGIRVTGAVFLCYICRSDVGRVSRTAAEQVWFPSFAYVCPVIRTCGGIVECRKSRLSRCTRSDLPKFHFNVLHATGTVFLNLIVQIQGHEAVFSVRVDMSSWRREPAFMWIRLQYRSNRRKPERSSQSCGTYPEIPT